MGYIKRKITTKANVQFPEQTFQQIKNRFIQQIVGLFKAHAIPPDLISNLDETCIKLVPLGDCMSLQGSKGVEGAGLGDKRQITATLPDTLKGAYLLMHLIYQGKTDHSLANLFFETVSTFITHQITGQMKERLSCSTKRSSFHM